MLGPDLVDLFFSSIKREGAVIGAADRRPLPPTRPPRGGSAIRPTRSCVHVALHTRDMRYAHSPIRRSRCFRISRRRRRSLPWRTRGFSLFGICRPRWRTLCRSFFRWQNEKDRHRGPLGRGAPIHRGRTYRAPEPFGAAFCGSSTAGPFRRKRHDKTRRAQACLRPVTSASNRHSSPENSGESGSP